MIIHTSTLDTEAKVKAIYGGNTWAKIEERFLLGASDNYPIGTEGGEAEHILTIAEMPSHNHPNSTTTSMAYGQNWSAGSQLSSASSNQASWKQSLQIASQGGGQAHNNMSPYRATYIWERIA